MEVIIKENERLDDLQTHGLYLIQPQHGYCFTNDAVLLSDFTRIKPNDVLCDFCTGSGVIMLLLAAKSCLKSAYGIELQPEVANMAERNIVYNNLQAKCSVICENVDQASKLLCDKKVTVVTVNPPYQKASVGRDMDPLQAAARCEINLTLQQLCSAAGQVLQTGGRMNVVYPASRLAELTEQLCQNRLTPKRMRFIQAKATKAAHLVLVEAVKNGKHGMQILSPLIMMNADGSESISLKQIYARRKK